MSVDPKSVDGRREVTRFDRWGFDQFATAAKDPSLSEHEKMGFPDAFRAEFEDAIWADMLAKLPGLQSDSARVLDIGSGCGGIARRMIGLATSHQHRLVMMDHAEMLAQLPQSPAVTMAAGRFPEDLSAAAAQDGFDVIIAYSVLQIVIVDANPFAFVDAAMALLRPGGRLLIGDIPNVSMLRRFLASDAGIAYHKAYMRTDQPPKIEPFAQATDRIDDGIVTGLLLRARGAGFHAYLLPQPPSLPLANRREDLIIERP